MRSTSRASRVAVTLAASALVLAACGDDGDEEEDTDTEPTAAETSEGEGGAAATGDGTLTVGTLLPQTGSLAFLGPPEFAGVQLAVNDINEAGGVLGKDVRNTFCITAWDPGRRVSFESTGGSFPIAVTRTVEPIGDTRSRFSEDVEGDARGFYRFADPLI